MKILVYSIMFITAGWRSNYTNKVSWRDRWVVPE